MKVLAPFSGVINRRHVEVGQWVQQGAPVAEIVQLDPLYVRTGVPEELLPRLKAGDAASVTIDALGGKEFQAAIAEVLGSGGTWTFLRAAMRLKYGIDVGMPRPPLGATDRPWADADVKRVVEVVDTE